MKTINNAVILFNSDLLPEYKNYKIDDLRIGDFKCRAGVYWNSDVILYSPNENLTNLKVIKNRRGMEGQILK